MAYVKEEFVKVDTQMSRFDEVLFVWQDYEQLHGGPSLTIFFIVVQKFLKKEL